MPPPPAHVALVGFMGAGKSTVGTRLARALGRPFLDTDAEVEARAGCRIADLFAAGEEEAFRALEAAVVRELLERPSAVLSLGGGAMADPATREELLERALVVHLHVAWDDVRAALPRLRATRPLLQGRTEAEIRALYEDRQAGYAGAHLRVQLARGDTEAAARELLALLGGRPAPRP